MNLYDYEDWAVECWQESGMFIPAIAKGHKSVFASAKKASLALALGVSVATASLPSYSGITILSPGQIIEQKTAASTPGSDLYMQELGALLVKLPRLKEFPGEPDIEPFV